MKLSNLTQRKGVDSHDIQGTGRNIVAHESGSLFYNTWALSTGSPRGELNRDNPFYNRVVKASTKAASSTYLNVSRAAADFTYEATLEQKLMNVPYDPEPMTRDIKGLPNISGIFMVDLYKPQEPGQTKSAPGEHGGRGFQPTPYKGVNPNYSNAYSHRGLYYMGCLNEEEDVCR